MTTNEKVATARAALAKVDAEAARAKQAAERMERAAAEAREALDALTIPPVSPASNHDQATRKVIPVSRWPHAWPTVNALRHMAADDQEFVKACIIRRAGRVLIDEAAFFRWLDGKDAATLGLEALAAAGQQKRRRGRPRKVRPEAA